MADALERLKSRMTDVASLDAMTSLLVCVNFAGDTLDDALNPRRSHR